MAGNKRSFMRLFLEYCTEKGSEYKARQRRLIKLGQSPVIWNSVFSQRCVMVPWSLETKMAYNKQEKNARITLVGYKRRGWTYRWAPLAMGTKYTDLCFLHQCLSESAHCRREAGEPLDSHFCPSSCWCLQNEPPEWQAHPWWQE